MPYAGVLLKIMIIPLYCVQLGRAEWSFVEYFREGSLWGIAFVALFGGVAYFLVTFIVSHLAVLLKWKSIPLALATLVLSYFAYKETGYANIVNVGLFVSLIFISMWVWYCREGYKCGSTFVRRANERMMACVKKAVERLPEVSEELPRRTPVLHSKEESEIKGELQGLQTKSYFILL